MWRNWAGNQRCRPAERVEVTTEADIASAVRRAAERGATVRAVGSGHSFTGCATTDGTLLDLSGYDQVLAVDAEAGTVTVQAGIRLDALSRHLAARGLALENLGDIAVQTVSGATATGTHGTGLRFGNLSTQIAGVRLVTGDGTVLDCSPHRHPEVLDAARVSLGALGVVSTLTLRCVPAFHLHAVHEPRPVDGELERFAELVREHDHYELFWVPGTRWALTKAHRRNHDPVAPRSRWSALRDDLLVDNVAFGAMCRLTRWRPEGIRRWAKLVPPARRVERNEPSHQVFASPRLVRFLEAEFAIPLEAVPAAVSEVRRVVAGLDHPVTFPVEVRAVAADDIPLSPAHGRDTGYIAVHAYVGTPHERYFAEVEAVMLAHGGRPHWGKLHRQTAATLAPRYPRWADFQAVRARTDPEGRFRNGELDRVLGPVGG